MLGLHTNNGIWQGLLNRTGQMTCKLPECCRCFEWWLLSAYSQGLAIIHLHYNRPYILCLSGWHVVRAYFLLLLLPISVGVVNDSTGCFCCELVDRKRTCFVVRVIKSRLFNTCNIKIATMNRSKVKVKFFHTLYRALGPELTPVYRQSARRWV